jgi:hypothetical protein
LKKTEDFHAGAPNCDDESASKEGLCLEFGEVSKNEASDEEGITELKPNDELVDDQVANATDYYEGTIMKGFYEEPLFVSSLITSSFTVRKERGDGLNKNSTGYNETPSSDEDSEDFIVNHDDTATEEDNLTSLLLIANFDSEIGEQSMAIPDQREEGFPHFMEDDRSTIEEDITDLQQEQSLTDGFGNLENIIECGQPLSMTAKTISDEENQEDDVSIVS